jgi:hypothetical protein
LLLPFMEIFDRSRAITWRTPAGIVTWLMAISCLILLV